jgi:hypothetical protein
MSLPSGRCDDPVCLSANLQCNIDRGQFGEKIPDQGRKSGKIAQNQCSAEANC